METTELFQNDAPANVAGQTGRTQRILVADDDPVMQEFYATVLTPFGYRVDGAPDGAAAWEALGINSYDLLITDNSMPKVSGLELIEKLRAAQLTLPAIMISGVLPEENPVLKISAALLKPVSAKALLENVSEVLRTAKADARPDNCSLPVRGKSVNAINRPQTHPKSMLTLNNIHSGPSGFDVE